MLVLPKRQIIDLEFNFRILVIADNKKGKNLFKFNRMKRNFLVKKAIFSPFWKIFQKKIENFSILFLFVSFSKKRIENKKIENFKKF